jgi:hypothetical protein
MQNDLDAVAPFDRNHLPSDTPVEWVDAVNVGIGRLRARKVPKLRFESQTHIAFCARWIEIYLQTLIRRGLCLIDSGLAEIKAGRTLIAAFCARGLLEDAALLWSFNRRAAVLLDDGNVNELDDYVFSKALASRLPAHIKRWGDEFKATNIITAIDNMTVELPNIRPMYDELSDVCHPNTHGVLWHFSAFDGDGAIAFDDGARKFDAALGALIFCSLAFVGEEPAISRLEVKLRRVIGHD